jgi:hypothetical protein
MCIVAAGVYVKGKAIDYIRRVERKKERECVGRKRKVVKMKSSGGRRWGREGGQGARGWGRGVWAGGRGVGAGGGSGHSEREQKVILSRRDCHLVSANSFTTICQRWARATFF